MDRPCSFDASRAYEHTRALCFPRRVGTVGERRAARYISRQLASLGLQCWRERFAVSLFRAEIASRLVFVSCAALVMLSLGLFSTWPVLASLTAGLAAVLVNAPWRVQRLKMDSLPPRLTSENVLATRPEKVKGAPARVVFLAHYDTKSQWLPSGVRVLLVSLATALCWALAVLGLAATLGVTYLPGSIATWLAGGVLVLLAGLFLNFTGNRSPGALDNGSAVGTLLELARCWRPHPEAPVEVVWVATGSEEIELDGARHLLRAHGAWWEDRPTLVINLESVGAGSFVYLAGEPDALRLAQATANESGIPHAPFSVLGAGMDHEPFAACGLPAVSILGDVIRRSFAMHSRRDNMSGIDLAALDRAGRLAADLAWRWAQLHQPAARITVEAAETSTNRMIPVPELLTQVAPRALVERPVEGV